MEQVTGLAPSGSLGSGFNLAAFQNALDAGPDFIGQDAGSTDMGPYYLGTAAPFLPRASYKHDLGLMLDAAREREIPLLVGSCLTSGTRPQLNLTVDIIRELAQERCHSFTMAVIDAELDKEFLKRRLGDGGIDSLGPGEDLTPDLVDRCPHIVAQMGMEPLIHALDAGADVVIAGRACDDAVFAAFPVMKGFDRGLSLHMGKILECAGLSAIPCDLAEPLLGRIESDGFLVWPGDPNHRCTSLSVAGHSLYERGDPGIQPGPGGTSDLDHATYRDVDRRTVRVTGSRFIPEPVYRVKLEGAEFVGYRSIVIVGVRDPVLIGQIDDLLQEMRDHADARFSECGPGAFRIDFHVYGKNAVMRHLEPVAGADPHEIGILINVVANDQDLASAVAMYVRGTLQHASYPGIIATAGNLAYPFSPFSVPVGPAYRFAVYHLLPLEDPCECFPMQLVQV
ncbi:MAG: acyclic terpene utilization AtuA family protein [Rhodobacteraceae bacterium]|nr:acyclic terpene utilization AtuA family protein [Paracoccaceae bacterium]